MVGYREGGKSTTKERGTALTVDNLATPGQGLPQRSRCAIAKGAEGPVGVATALPEEGTMFCTAAECAEVDAAGVVDRAGLTGCPILGSESIESDTDLFTSGRFDLAVTGLDPSRFAVGKGVWEALLNVVEDVIEA